MQIKDPRKLNVAVKRLDEAMDLINGAIEIPDNEVNTEKDFYDRVRRIKEELQEVV